MSGHIFVTGPPGVGKTTLIRRICSELLDAHIQSLSLSGFYTEEVRDLHKGSRIGFDVVTLPGGTRGPLARVSDHLALKLSGPSVGNYRVDIASFESLALPSLAPPNAAGVRTHVAVVDEVGKMELFSARFCSALPPLFERPHTLVLGTLMERRGPPLAEQIRSRPGIEIVAVTRENRDALVNQLCQRIVSALNSMN